MRKITIYLATLKKVKIRLQVNNEREKELQRGKIYERNFVERDGR